MAEVRFFKKLGDNFRFVFSNNRDTVEFTTLDGLMGYFATNSEIVQGELDKAIAEQRSAVIEITQEEFHRDYVQKKSQGLAPLNKHSRPNWREEMGAQSVSRTAHGPLEKLGAEVVAAVVGVNGNSDIPAEAPATIVVPANDRSEGVRVSRDTIIAPEPVPAPKKFEPNLGKRKQR